MESIVVLTLGQFELKPAYPTMQAALKRNEEGLEATLIQKHERLIRCLANQFRGKGVPLDDLLQEGRLALWLASKKWLGLRGASVWTYARRDVFASMLRLATEDANQAGPRDVDNEENTTDLEIKVFVAECLSALSDTERNVVVLFMQGESIRGIAQRLGKSKSTIGRVFDSAVATLREHTK